MRIRTIKPEFWTDAKLQSLGDSSKLLAIALLNYADDEGYFLADVRLIRSSCRPFDDNSTITQRCIADLSKIGYISLFKCAENGSIGFIKNFSKHQKIDRPSESKLKSYINSTNTRRILDDPSLLEQGTGNREKEQGENIISFLNLKSGKSFKNTQAHFKHISARLKEGFSENDFHSVIEFKVAKWANDPKMKEYLRPETLFGTKFDSYLQEARLNHKPPVNSTFKITDMFASAEEIARQDELNRLLEEKGEHFQ